MTRMLPSGLLVLISLFFIPKTSEAFSSKTGPTGYGAHGEITQEALAEYDFSPDAIRVIQRANVAEDRHPLQARRHHDRWNGESVEKACKRGRAYIEREVAKVLDYLENGDYERALEALGRAAHTVQDVFSHSNYCDMQAQDQEKFIQAVVPPSGAVVYGQKFPEATRITGFPFRDRSDRYGYSHTEHAKDDPDTQEGPEAFEKAKAGALKATKELVERTRESLRASLGSEPAEKAWQGFVNY